MNMDDIRKSLEDLGGHVQELHAGQKMTTRMLEALKTRSEASEQTIVKMVGTIQGMKGAFEQAFDRLDDHEARIRALETRKP